MSMLRRCEDCGKQFEAQRSDRRFCSSACKARAARRPKRARARAWEPGPISEAAGSALREARREGTWQGLKAMKLALAMDAAGPDQPAATLAALDRQFTAAMALALAESAAPDKVSEIQERADEVSTARRRKAG